MALTKKKKRLLLIVLAMYLVVSAGLAVLYKMQMAPFESEEQKALKAQQIADIEKHLGGLEYTITEEQAKKIREVLHEDGGKEAQVAEIRRRLDKMPAPAATREKAAEIQPVLYGIPGSVMSVNLTIIMQIVNFGALLAILYLLLWEPLTRFLDERSQSIQDDIESAKNKKAEADKVLREYRETLHDARDEVASIIEEGRRRGEEKEREIIEEARREAGRIKERTEAELRGEVEAARRALRRDFATVSVSIAEKILTREIKEEDHHAFVEEALHGLESEGVKF